MSAVGRCDNPRMPASEDPVRWLRKSHRWYAAGYYLRSRRALATVFVSVLSIALISLLFRNYEGAPPIEILRTHDDLKAWATVIAAVMGAALPALFMLGTAIVDRRSRTALGRLVVHDLIKLLRRCYVDSFHIVDTTQRHLVIRKIGKIAATIEGIPDLLGVREPDVVLAARQRASWVRAIQSRVATMSSEDDRREIIADLFVIRYLYNTGQWMKLPTYPVIAEPRISAGARIWWAALAAISFAAIVAVVILTAMSEVPTSAIPICFFLGVLFYSSLVRLGISGDALKQAVDVASTAHVSFTQADHRGSSESSSARND